MDPVPLPDDAPAPGRSTWPARLRPAARFFAPHWPACAASVLLLALMAVDIHRVKAAEGGRFVYPIDDSYMHLAVARNLLRHGSWAVSSYNGFSHCISSLVWPWLVALSFVLFGQHDYDPIILNALAAVGALLYAGHMIRRPAGTGVPGALVLCAVVFLTPMMPVVLLGMEHSLQILASLVFVDLAARLLTADGRAVRGRFYDAALCAVAFLLVITRYEGLFLVAIVGLLLLCRRRWVLAAALGLAAAAPLTVFGCIALSKGWAFFPNSLLLKTNLRPVLTAAGLADYFSKGYVLLVSERHFFTTFLALTVSLIVNVQRRATVWTYSTLILLITFVAALEHLQFASLGWFYRYEAYLIVLTLVGVSITLGENLPGPASRHWRRGPGLVQALALGAAAVLLGAPLWQRAAFSFDFVVQASYNVYEQQYQMGRFVRQFYNGRGVAANDIGAVTYLGDVRLVDTHGLATLEVLRAEQDQTYDVGLVRSLCQQHAVEVAIVYDDWVSDFHGPVPEWTPVGRWTIRNNRVCGSQTVTFYAANAGFAPRLLGALQQFARLLPADVIQDGAYLGRCSDVQGVYYPETNGQRTLYWTRQRARFTLYPIHGEALGSDATTLTLSYLPMMDDQRIEIFFNGQRVSDEPVAPGTAGRWKTVTVQAKWLPGQNVLLFAGHGSIYPAPHDGRELLYQVLDPLDALGADGTFRKPGVPPGLPP